tara:strand:- start:477 stop:617 length:141 start_codon:yes stop_codon:yes gene_type:complete
VGFESNSRNKKALLDGMEPLAGRLVECDRLEVKRLPQEALAFGAGS